MAISQLDLTGPLEAATPLATIAQASRQRKTEELNQQEHALTLQRLSQQIQESKKKADDEKAITDIIKAGGEPQEVSKRLLEAGYPDASRTYLTNSQADVLQAQQQALLRAKTLEGQVAPEVAAAAPQAQMAPIQTSLTDQTQTAVPAAPPQPQTQQVPTPLPSVDVPFIGQPSTTIRPQSAQQLTLAERAKTEFNAALEARKKSAEGVIIPEGAVLHRDGQPDVTGQPKLSEIEKEAQPWLARPENKGKTIADYVQQKSEFGQKLNAFNSDVVLTAKYGTGPVGMAKWEQDQAIDKSVRTANAEAGGKIGVAKIEAQNRADIAAAEEKSKKQAALNEPPPKVKQQVSDSNQSLDQIDTIRKLVAAKPYLIGPVAGRLDKYENAAGTSFGLKTPEDERDAQRLLANLGNLLVNENLVASPGRTNKELLAILKAQGASISQNANFLEGSLRGAEDRAQQAIVNGQRYGINVPRGTSSQSDPLGIR
jgi:hypothetical protein